MLRVRVIRNIFSFISVSSTNHSLLLQQKLQAAVKTVRLYAQTFSQLTKPAALDVVMFTRGRKEAVNKLEEDLELEALY